MFDNSVFVADNVTDSLKVHTVCEPQKADTANSNDYESKKAIGIGCYIVVDYLNQKAKQPNPYVGLATAQQDDDFEVNFMRKANKTGRAFVFPKKFDIHNCVKMFKIVTVLDESCVVSYALTKCDNFNNHIR